MDKFIEELLEELECNVVFEILLGNGHSIPVFESVAVTWIIMTVLIYRK